MPARAASILSAANPDFVDREEIERGRETLNDLAQEAGRDPASIQVLAFGGAGQYRTRKAIDALDEAGADRATIWLESNSESGALEEIADGILRRLCYGLNVWLRFLLPLFVLVVALVVALTGYAIMQPLQQITLDLAHNAA